MSIKNIIKSRAFKDFSIILLLLGLITLIFDVTRLDISLQSYFYSASEGWFLKFKPFWDYFYRFGIFPGYLFGLAGLIMIALSYRSTQYAKYRRAAMMLVYTMVLGPGLIINLGLKDHWGRPRPFEIKEFGGKQEFLYVCVPGPANGGKSFPCGHCSMGFFLAVPYLIFRNRNKKLAYAFLVFGLIYGLLLGLSRMIAGGHFASDVLWSGGLVWLIALSGAYLFKIDKPIEINESGRLQQKKKARLATLIVSILLLMITLGLVLATPYVSQKSIIITEAGSRQEKNKTYIVDLKDATADIVVDTCLRISYKVSAFGFPNSKIRGRLIRGDTTRYLVQWMGWFTEVTNMVSIGFPANIERDYIIQVNNGEIFCNLPDSGRANFSFHLGKGDLFLNVNAKNYLFEGDSNFLVNNSHQSIHWASTLLKQDFQKTIRFNVKKGKVILQ